jgi:hypothetical protein
MKKNIIDTIHEDAAQAEAERTRAIMRHVATWQRGLRAEARLLAAHAAAMSPAIAAKLARMRGRERARVLAEVLAALAPEVAS